MRVTAETHRPEEGPEGVHQRVPAEELDGAAHPDVAPHAEQGTWLCPDGFARRRLIDMESHMRAVRVTLFVILALSLAVLSPWIGLLPLVPLAGAVIGFAIADRAVPRSERPEYWFAGAWAFSQLMIGVAVAATGGPESVFVPWLAIPAATLSARFSDRGVLAGVGWTAAIMAGATVGVDPEPVVDSPQLLVVPLTLLVGVGVLSMGLMRSDVKHRTEAALDPLTGLLNRQALAQRASDLIEQGRADSTWFAVLIADLDHFKAINDRQGHLAGDEVLRATAHTIASAVRSCDLVSRYGGEEFVVLAPAAPPEAAVSLAERLRTAVGDVAPGGTAVSVSVGVAAARGHAADFQRLLGAADRGLYRAKASGRDRVVAEAAAS